ncbi:MAG: hypothetical protein SOW23_02765, partial [Eubacteriales bacterium]|nr:hypothetical protein [Eubacteriales bacterium]
LIEFTSVLTLYERSGDFICRSEVLPMKRKIFIRAGITSGKYVIYFEYAVEKRYEDPKGLQ